MTEKYKHSNNDKLNTHSHLKSHQKLLNHKISGTKKVESFHGSKFNLNMSDQQYLKIISKLNDVTFAQSIKEQDFKASITILKKLQNTIESFNNGSLASNKKSAYYHYFVCYFNFAMTYQRMQENRRSFEYFEKALKNYELIQGYIINRQDNIVYLIELVKLQLQFCGILSHQDKHELALVYAEKSLNKTIECFRIMEAICYQNLLYHAESETTSNSRERGSKIQLINFKSVVITQAYKYLQQLTQLPSSHKLILQSKETFELIIKKIIFLKNNDKNNQKALRRELKLDNSQILQPRNILGLQKRSNFGQIYHIGNLMSLQMKFIKYSQNNDPFYLLSIPKLTEMIFYASVSYFTLATQTRFSQNDLCKIETLKITEKYQKLNHDQRVSKCKILHLKALQIAGKYLPPQNSHFSHMLSSFNRNYKSILDQINEQSQQISIKSILKQEKHQPQKCQKNIEYGLKEILHNQQKADRNQKYFQRKRTLSQLKSPGVKKRKQRTSSISKKSKDSTN